MLHRKNIVAAAYQYQHLIYDWRNWFLNINEDTGNK